MNFNLNEGLWAALVPSLSGETAASVLYLVFAVVAMVCAYLLGSVNSAIIISRVFYHDDIRRYGSGNAGMTNMLRTYGKGAALGTLAGDVTKTALAVFLGGTLLGFGYVGGIALAEGGYIAGLFAVLGHIFPVYYKFRGGKGVLASATMALILSPACLGIMLLIFVLIVAMTKYVSLGSVSAGVLYPVLVKGYISFCFPGAREPGMVALVTILIACLLVFCHRGNLKRIGERTERKLSFKKVEKEKKDDHDGE